MRKFLVIVFTALFVAGFYVSSFAEKAARKSSEKKFERIVAEVVSVDTAAKTMVVTREENGETRTIAISAKAAAQLEPGDRVRIKLKAGTNESAGVRVLGAKPGADQTALDPEANTEAKPEVK